jgi:DNA-binding XRE family transcriptional regulator
MAKVKQKSILARNIILRRKALGMNQETFASKVGIGKTTLAEIETDVSEGWLTTRKAIADFLKCNVEDLYKNPDQLIENKSPLDQAVLITQAQLKALSEESNKKGAQAVIDAINRPPTQVYDDSPKGMLHKLIEGLSADEAKKIRRMFETWVVEVRTPSQGRYIRPQNLRKDKK